MSRTATASDHLYYHPAAHTGPEYTHVPSGTPDRCHDFTVSSDHMVPMRDGVRLATDVYLPKADGSFPVILIRLPYGKTEPVCLMPIIGGYWARKGYACVVQDVRGKWGSEGEFVPAHGATEVADGYDTIEWITRQAFSNRRVGMWGESYYGFTSYAGAVGGHPALAAIAPGNISVDRYRNVYRGGTLQLNTMGNWAMAMAGRNVQDVSKVDHWCLPLKDMPATGGIASRYFQDIISNPSRGAFWEERSLLEAHDRVRVPMLLWGGWYDTFLGQQLADWDMIAKRNKGQSHLLIGPWDHEGSYDQTDWIGGIHVGLHGEHRWDTYQAFFDHYVMGIGNGFDRRPPIEYFTMGRSAWRQDASWPPARAVPTPYYLTSGSRANTLNGDGRLAAEPQGDGQPDQFIYDPLQPVADTLAISCWGLAKGLSDRRSVETRDDVLVYSTEPLVEDVEVTGPVTAVLYAATSAVDTDFWMGLVDVRPDGFGTLIQDGIVRASARSGAGQTELLEPGRVYRFEIDLWATSILFRAGHRIRVEITSSCFNKYARNTNTGVSLAEAASPVRARQSIYHDREHPSHILLPIVRAAGG